MRCDSAEVAFSPEYATPARSLIAAALCGYRLRRLPKEVLSVLWWRLHANALHQFIPPSQYESVRKRTAKRPEGQKISTKAYEVVRLARKGRT